MVGGLLALFGAGAMSAKPKKGSKDKKKRGDVSAAADKSETHGNLCCKPCPATGNECTVVVRDASSGECVEIARLYPTLCNNNQGICDQGVCYECQGNEVLCPNGCADLSNNALNCGACGNFCDEPGYQCVDGQCTIYTPPTPPS